MPVTITINEDNIDERVESFFKDLSLIATEDGEVVLRPIQAECFIRDIPRKYTFLCLQALEKGIYVYVYPCSCTNWI